MKREKVLRFGVERGLSGIVSEPVDQDSTVPAVVILNSGILHHVGPSRIYVRFARRLAADGHMAFRFDFSGIGDSEPRKDALPFVESAPLESMAAMDLIQKKYGVDDFWLIGLCSGADMAFKVAAQDERVRGIVQLDPYAYRTRGYYLRRYGPKLLDPRAYIESIRGRRRNAEIARERASTEHEETYTSAEYRRIFPPRDEIAADLARLVDRKVRMLNIFSDGQSEHINHAEQYARAFPELDFGDLLSVDYVNHASHTFTDLGDQDQVEQSVARWATAGREAIRSASADRAA